MSSSTGQNGINHNDVSLNGLSDNEKEKLKNSY